DDALAGVRIRCGGQSYRLPLRAGRDTAEWAYDRADVSAVIKHARARVATNSTEKSEAGEFQAHSYLARLRLPAEAALCDSTISVGVVNRPNHRGMLGRRRPSPYDPAPRRASHFRK